MCWVPVADGLYVTWHVAELPLPHPEEKNVLYFRHGTLRMGKLLMIDADMEVTDTDPSDPFDFFIDRYNDQLVAGYSKNTPSHGLKVYMPDYHSLPRARATSGQR